MASESSMDSFCGSKFWDTNLTWYSADPDLTTCFQQTVLVWAPCAFLWVFSILELFYLRQSKTRDIPWNWNNGSRLALTGLLIILSVVDLIVALTKQNDEAIYPLHLYGPVIKIATFVLAGSLVYFNKLHGIRASGLLFLFWFFMVILSIPRCRTEARTSQYRKSNNSENSWAEYQYISFLIFFASSILILLVNCFGDAEPRESFYPKTNNPCPEVGASFLSRLFFGWFDALAWKGFRNPLEEQDLWQMKPEDTSKEVYPLFSRYWLKTVASKAKENDTTTKATFSKDAASVNFIQPTPKKPASILPAICKAFGPTFLFGAFLKLLQDVLTFVSPQVLRLIINFIDSDEPEWKGILYAVLLFLVAGVQTLFLAQYFNRMFLVGLRIRTALISAIYRKALVMSNSSRKESTVGEIVNLMAVDAQRFMDLAAYINMLWSAPLQIALALYFLWEILGPSVLAGLAVMIILIPVNGVIANKVKILQIKQMKNKDERVKLMNEILSGIKVLKLYAWEPSFEDQVLKIRDKEVKVLKSAAYLNAGTSFIWSCAPFLVSIITFTTYVMSSEENVLTVSKAFVCLTLFDIIKLPLALLPMLIVYMIEVALVTFATFVMVDENNVLNATTAFVSLSLFNILRFPLSMLPMMISNMVQTSVSVKRLNKFMNCEELNPANVQHDPNEKHPLTIDHGTFSWGGDTTVLRDINMKIEKQSLVAVVGSVGSGKSSLISAYLGEMDKIQGKVNTHGKIAYVSQQAWIQNATLKDNILFGSQYDKKLYDRVIVACALKPDIDMLPGGDQTEIGEKGINLSGGQKQRVSLARAVYNDADIYFLDDPLSAVDSHVGKHIFEQVIGPTGILGNKTRVLVTHGITYLPQVNHIYVLKDGEISESGGYQQLLDKKGAFAEFLIQHLQEITEDEEVDLDELKQQLDSNLVPEELRGKLELAISRTRSDSNSDSGSHRSSLTRQQSTDSAGDTGSLRRRITEKTKSNTALDKDPSKDKLIEKETSETGSVKWDVYKHYLKSIGVFLSIITIVLNMIFQGFSIGSNIWLSKWSSDPDAGTDTGLRDMYLGVYGAFGAGQAISSFICDIAPQLGCLKAAVILHMKMLFGIFKAPILFFDTTPSGRILSRFSKDVDVLDTTLPEQLGGILYCFFEISQNFLAIARIIFDITLLLGCWMAARRIHNILLSHIMHDPMEFFDTTPIGRIISRFSKDIDVVDSTIPEILLDWIICAVEVVATVVVISISSPLFMTVILPIGVLYYFVQRFYVATSRQLKRLESVSRSPIYSHFGESITGTTTIRAYHVQQRFVQESEDKVDFNQVCYFPSIIANRWLAVRLEMVGNLIILFAALFAVLGRDTMNAGLVGLSVSYALQITQTLNWLVRMTSDVETNIVAVERIKEYGETKQEAPWEVANVTVPANWPEMGRVEFKDYQVRYREGLDLVLRGISFTVNGGEKVGIVGRTGAGKSSLTLSLFRIIEAASGQILIDGQDISKLGLHALRSRLTIIPQDPVLFSGTLRINLDPFNKYNDVDVWRALEHAHLKAFVKGLTAGLNHEVTEGGENLSVGQRQLICLARALLRKTKVLILDEATAAVDLETDDLIQKTIRTEFRDCTVLTIAHRLNTIMDSDKVLVLDKGEAVEFASPQSLLQNRKSIFYGMAKDAGLV